MRRYAAKVDSNQNEIVEILRNIGATVQTLHTVGFGCPDILVGFRGRNYLFEIKIPGARRNPAQIKWHNNWRGEVHTIKCAGDGLRIIGAIGSVDK